MIRKNPDGSLTIPLTDPSDKAPFDRPHAVSGFVTDAGGSWHTVDDAHNMTHVLDVATAADGSLYEFGSDDYPGQAQVWRSTDQGATWAKMLAQSSKPGSENGFERYNWGRPWGSGVVTNANYIDSSPAGIQMGSGTSWKAVADAPLVANAGLAESFDSKIVYSDFKSATVAVFDGSTATAKMLPDGKTADDFYVAADGYLYVLSTGNNIFRLKSTDAAWEPVASTVGSGFEPTSIAVAGDKIYLGDNQGRILRSNQTIAASSGVLVVPPGYNTRVDCSTRTDFCVQSFSPAPLSAKTGSHRYTVTGSGLDKAGVYFSFGGKKIAMPVQSASARTLVVTLNTNSLPQRLTGVGGVCADIGNVRSCFEFVPVK